ncbi:MAG: acetyl-CoA synthetase [Paracoccaceae bacterium]|jgi:acetyl-CoA synthetase
MQDAERYFWCVGRSNDPIKGGGHLIGPFETQSTVIEHPAETEVAVIGVPDKTMREPVKAYVALKLAAILTAISGWRSSGMPANSLAPRWPRKRSDLRKNLSKTRNGKIMRRPPKCAGTWAAAGRHLDP